ncbi:MAG: histidine phosphatase family protein [Anaerolineae bacterium]|nr:histidine phosphatase family protein [Anaerolineae bacterium]
MMTWYIIRHADKEQGDFYNPRLGHQDQPISQKGRQDGQKLSSFFSDKQIAAIYVSAYQRTRQTIEAVAQQLRLMPMVDERLNEIDNGRIEGLTEPEIQQAFPEVWRAYVERSADFRFPGGETGTEAQRRIVDFFEEKRLLHYPDNIILVSHDGLIRLLMCYLVNMPVYKRWNFQVDLCGLMEVAYQPDVAAWQLIRFNQACR